MVECPAKYKNLGLSSFDEQREITVQMLRQICMNDEYLKQHIDNLEYMSPAAVNKRFTPVNVDKENSYGYKIDTSNDVIFDTSTSKEVDIDFDDMSLIDINKSTCVIESLTQDNEIIKQAKVPQLTVSTLDTSTRNYSPWAVKDSDGNIIGGDMTANEHWYVGFDKNREYQLRPNWLNNQYNNEIPSIGRAQTFKANKTGLLESVVLNIKINEGQDRFNTASPLIVQIRKVINKNGVKYPEGLACDYDGKYTILAEESIRFNNSSPDIVSVTFDNPCTVKKGETYAIVVLSPLSHYSHCYWLGGFNKHCNADTYTDGDAFYTFDNGMTWIRYGKDDDVEYHSGKYAPQDFIFQCHIREFKTGYIVNKDYYLYLKPILSNPVKSVLISARDTGDAGNSKIQIEYQVSNDGRSWHTIGDNHRYDFNTPNCMTFIRARLKTTVDNETPLIENITVQLNTDVPSEMYVRTQYYYPKTSPMLGANIWGRLNAPFTVEPTVRCNVEIIRNKEVTEHFVVIEPKDIENYTWIDGIIEDKVKNRTNAQMYKYLTDNPSVIDLLANYQVYVKGYTDAEGYKEGFFDRLKFISRPAYPILECNLQPDTGSTRIYGEWYDFKMDYDENNEMIFYNDVLKDMPAGTFNITYNPLFIADLTNEEMPLVLDYFKENILVDDTILENRRVSLRAAPVDPIRKVVLNPDSDNTELIEDVDYTVDYDAKELIFNVINTDDESTILSLNDVLQVVYTPNLDDAGISIGYYAKRENIRKQCYIKPNSIEYKT